MYIAFQRTIGTTSMSMIAHDDWGRLKIMVCEKWGADIEHVFDKHDAWTKLTSGTIITFAGNMYQVWNAYEEEFVDELFQGRHIEIFDEDK